MNIDHTAEVTVPPAGRTTDLLGALADASQRGVPYDATVTVRSERGYHPTTLHFHWTTQAQLETTTTSRARRALDLLTRAVRRG